MTEMGCGGREARYSLICRVIAAARAVTRACAARSSVTTGIRAKPVRRGRREAEDNLLMEGLRGRAECLLGVGFVANQTEEFAVRLLTDEETSGLRGIPAIALSETGSRRLASVVRRLSDILRTTVALAGRSDRQWRVVASHVVSRVQMDEDADLWAIVDEACAAGDVRVAALRRSVKWTILPLQLSASRRAALIMAGDWRLVGPTLVTLGEQLSAAFRSPTPTAAGLRRASHRLSRRLARTHGPLPVASAIVDAMATSVRARLAAIAVADPADRRLSIKATYGYPLMLVEHMRIEPGQGIFGSAFETGKVIRAPGGAGSAQPSRRPRYRTDSFIALPILEGEDVLAVICVADRIDDRAFTRSDLSAMRALAAPAALALSRERAAARAEAYAHAAAVDPVSGLFNRRYFHVRLDEELQRSRRHEIPLALLMIDIDDFKGVNDRYGHLAGDGIIRETAEILRRAVRVFDVCTRFGGEEFAVIMPASSEDGAAAVAERIRARVAAFGPTERGVQDLRVSVSIGLALSEPDLSARDLISRADEALYDAKRSGKNRVRAFPAEQAGRP
jgi:diguanylate cyclase (GGDEF)-like protein